MSISCKFSSAMIFVGACSLKQFIR